MTQLVWLRSDLRVADNPALCAAMGAGPTLALFLVTPGQWRAHDEAPAKVDFRLRTLAALAGDLAALGVPLLVRILDTWAEVPATLAALCRERQVRAVQVNDEYGADERRRDQAVDAALADEGVAFQRHLDQTFFPPGSVLTRGGGYFQVFGQFRKVCRQRLHSALPACLATPEAQAPLPLAGETPPIALPGFEVSPAIQALWPAGEGVARERLRSFVEEDLGDYHLHRDLPARAGTSGLSAYLAVGALSPRQCLHGALSANQGEFDSGRPGAVTWIDELLWREFYRHVLAGYPRVSMHRAFRRETEALPWRQAPDELLAWQRGLTGFPLIDAAMRQLLATGWMHNRLRMVAAMFLSKNLLIDWREGERFFMAHLIDGDLASNNGGWQWSASTGTDSVPYFRLFNPLSQSRRFDPQGRFIRQWLPELAGCRDIHQPSVEDRRIAGYPPPLVDLGESRARALAAFRDLPRPG
ncbi:deoxyribodipyrimidine photo-lyase [Pseudomonas sp. RIT-PI-AD]|uniref:deoxyribodipyrimidine photo-lyase n=1 Tax=Pseudomonas sp. RIT-PI-AD TaxID=3035294 RepID=UPI0021D7E143|nr:deoxyribodipyrimidine photo-lyase [Pseudomonas sp. RIT-PI-AD]